MHQDKAACDKQKEDCHINYSYNIVGHPTFIIRIQLQKYITFMASYSFDVLKIRDFRIVLITRMFAAMALQATGHHRRLAGIFAHQKPRSILGLTGLAEACAGHYLRLHRRTCCRLQPSFTGYSSPV